MAMKRLNKIVERSYFKDASANKYCMSKDFPRGIWPKRTIVFDAAGQPYREYYYSKNRNKSVGIVHNKPKYPGWQFIDKTEQKDEKGQTIFYRTEYQDTHSGRLFEEYHYEYQNGIKVKELHITRFEEVIGLSIFIDELFFDERGSLTHKKSYLNNSDKSKPWLIEDIQYRHTYDVNGNAIQTDYFKEGIHMLRISRKYYYDRI